MALDPLPVDAEVEHLCLSGRHLIFIHGVFSTQEKADRWAAAANIWYGEGHPLHPVRVEPVKRDIRPFPAAELDALKAADSPEAQDAAIHAMFGTLLDEPHAPPGLKGGRKR